MRLHVDTRMTVADLQSRLETAGLRIRPTHGGLFLEAEDQVIRDPQILRNAERVAAWRRKRRD